MARVLHGSARTPPRIRAELKSAQAPARLLAGQYGLNVKMAFADLPKNREGPTRRFLGPHIFDRVCLEHGIEHRLTKPYHPWTNGQAERMNRTVKEATVKTFHYDELESLKAHVLSFVTAYNFAKHLKALRWKTPFQSICDAWKSNPSAFKINPYHLIPGPHN
jgi:hypothetical protein